MFNASNFSNVSNQWEIAFSIWRFGETKNKESFDCTVEEISKEGNINAIGLKSVYNVPMERHLKTTEINRENFEDCFSLFAARRLIKANWINQKEEYKDLG